MDIDSLPEEIDRSGVANTPAAIANFCLVTVIPRLNEVIENQRALIKALRDEDPVRDGTPGAVDVAGGDGGDDPVDELFGDTGFEAPETGGIEEAPGEPSEGMEDMQALSQLMEDLDSRAAQNLGQEDYADPETLRTTPDEELREVNFVADEAIEKIRNVFPYDEATTE